MPWARIPADRLIHLPLFGIDVIADDGDFVWMRGPSGRMRVNKMLPRIFFETIEDAYQAGAIDIRIGSAAEEAELDAFNKALEEKSKVPDDPVAPDEEE
jgi:hypothetical protein